MERIIRIAILLTISLLFLVGCNTGPSIEKYFVESSEKQGFFSADIPASMLKSEAISLEESDKKILNSFEKINFLGFKRTADNKADFVKETATIKSILKSKAYESLMKFTHKDYRATVKIKGDADKIDEVIVYGYNSEKGFGLVRILGNDMNPALLMQTIKKLEKGDINTEGLQKVAGFVKGF